MDTTASLIAIVDLAFKVIRYMNDVHEGGKERSELHQQVLTVYDLLWNLKYEFESNDLDEGNTWSKPISALFKPGGTIDQLKLVLEQVASKLVLPSHGLERAVKFIKWPFDKAEVQRILSRLRSLTSSISIAFGRANLHVGVDTNKEVRLLRHATESAELETALKWMSPLDFRMLQKAARRRPLIGTGSWFLNNPQVRGWADGRTRALWCHGIPGTGKTVLATALYQKLQEEHACDNVAVLIAYCSFDDANTHSSSNIMSSFLRQLIEKRGQMSETIRKLYTEYVQSREHSRPDHESLVEALSKELKTFNKTFIIVDGLDELRENKQKVELLQTIESLDPLPQLLVTSRPVDSVTRWFKEVANEDRYRTRAEFEEEQWSYYYCENCHQPDEYDKDSFGSGSDISGKDFDLINAEGSEEQSGPGKNYENWMDVASYHCSNCSRVVCVNCYEQYDVCSGCNQPKGCFQWAWPGTVTITAHLEDLEQYILWRIDINDNLKALLEHARAKACSLSDTVVNRVQEESHKMFLLAKFHMNALEQQVTARDLINALETLPSNIDDIYNSVFNRISSQRLASTLEKLLIVVATARKLLSTEALAHAITVQQDDDDVDELAIPDVRHLASMCSGLIVIDPFGYVRLVHETIGDYIGKTGLKQSKSGHTMLAELCLIYLQFSAFSSGACGGPEREVLLQERQLKYPFLRYAATHWGVHTQLAYVNGPSFLGTDILGGMAGKLMSKSENVAAATQFMWLDDIETSSGWDAEENVHGLHLSAYFGLTDTVSNLLATDVNADVDVQDCLQTTPLMYAAQAGHADIVRLLLHTGADPGRICRRGRTALHRACERNYDAVVKEIVLSPKDVAVNAIDGGSYSLSALMWAVSNNNSNIIKHLLLRNDIDVNLKRPNQNKLNAFHQCVVKGQIDNAKLLLSDGRVMIESMSSSRETALPLAVRRGYDEMVALLLEWGADADTRDIYDGPPLLRAADENSLECVRILVEHGVDYQFRDFHGRGILHGCANHGRSTIMRYLLENLKDLDPNTQGDRGETPLHDAVFRNTEAVARVLLEYGARTDIRDRHGKTPLRMARDANLDKLFDLLRSARLKEIEAVKHAQQSIRPDGEAELVEQLKRTDTLAEDYKISIEAAVQSLSGNELETYLDEMGADAVGAINDPTRELLQTIIMSQQFHNLRILLDRGADINSRDKWGYTPLHAAIHTSQYETAEFLLDRGCNINQRDLLNRSPLTFCTTWNFMPVIAFLLLKRGATFNGPERDSLVPMLSYAVDCDEFDVVKILVEGGVPFRNKDTRGLTPYQRAKQAGHERIAQYIYEQARKGRSKPQDSKQVAGEVAHDPIEETSKESSGVAEDEVPTHEDGQRGDTTKSKERIDEKHGISSLQDRLGMTRRETGLLSIIIMLMMLLLFK